MSTNHLHIPVKSTAPAAPYVGGKRLLAKQLISRIEAINHHCYAEPFVGMGGVFLRRRHAAPSEVVNDLSRDVFTFFRVVQEHFAYFTDLCNPYQDDVPNQLPICAKSAARLQRYGALFF